ncbi:MAG: hypothetical protein RLZZ15_1242 [Verrucomicrobiota bacterium]|jgi:hypothetical protein
MSAPAAAARRTVRHVRIACGACVAGFLWAVAQFYAPATGFTSFLSIGDALDARQIAALRATPHHVYENSVGYDGAYYAQIALDPALASPEFTRAVDPAVDNLAYRARRSLFSWVAWALGFGRPASILQVHALLNVAAWLALAALLWRWFPPTDWGNFFRWAGVMFSSGVTMSVRNALVDLPSLLLIALAVRWIEVGRTRAGHGLLALAGLGRETNLLAVSALADGSPREPRAWLRLAGRAALAALPLALWMFWLRWKLGPTGDAGLGNFSPPFAGLAEKWGEALAGIVAHPFSPTNRTTLAYVLALTAQFLFFALRWRPADVWWRVGAAYALLLAFLATPVWEGFPGAAARVVLPMMLAFNLTVPRGGRWWLVLLAGNLGVFAAYKDFTPPREFFQVRAEGVAAGAVTVERTGAWHGCEQAGAAVWRWSGGAAGLRLRNTSGAPVRVIVTGRVASAEGERRVRLAAGEALVWSEVVSTLPEALRGGCTLAPGETELRFTTDRPAGRVGGDERPLAYKVLNLEIVVRPLPATGSGG